MKYAPPTEFRKTFWEEEREGGREGGKEERREGGREEGERNEYMPVASMKRRDKEVNGHHDDLEYNNLQQVIDMSPSANVTIIWLI